MNDPILCSLCGRDAFYAQRYSGRSFCRRCYPKAFEKRVRDHIGHARLLRPHDRIAVAVSGGKDSVSLLHVLARIETGFPDAQLAALSIDEGIKGYRAEAIEIAAQNAAKLGIDHHVLSFKQLYGHTLDEVAQAAHSKGQSSICAYCGILRRKSLNIAARNIGASVLATAHNLDDEAQSALMSILRGDLNSIAHGRGVIDGFIPRVKPFSSLPEAEIALYAFLKRIRFQTAPCPYAGTSLRNDVRAFLDSLDEEHLGMKFNVKTALERLSLKTNGKEGTVGSCPSCGEPSSRGFCRSCQILRELEILK